MVYPNTIVMVHPKCNEEITEKVDSATAEKVVSLITKMYKYFDK
ncbi:hypothetical protein [Cellulosilyticum ruminicola]|nr:hypothetical protein [Cellulosilyticum ruminicola]